MILRGCSTLNFPTGKNFKRTVRTVIADGGGHNGRVEGSIGHKTRKQVQKFLMGFKTDRGAVVISGGDGRLELPPMVRITGNERDMGGWQQCHGDIQAGLTGENIHPAADLVDHFTGGTGGD